MKKELSPTVVIAVIAVVAVIALAVLWKGFAGKKDTMSPMPKGGLPFKKGNPSR